MEYMKQRGWKKPENKVAHALLQADIKALKSIKNPGDVRLAVAAFLDIYMTPMELPSGSSISPATLKAFGEGFNKVYLCEGQNGSNPLALTWIDAAQPPASGQQGYSS